MTFNINGQGKLKGRLIALLSGLSIALFIHSCAYDSRHEIDPFIPCDTTKATFSLTIKPILNNHCIVCHSGSSPANGLDYEKYSDVFAVASDGRLVGAINHLPGYQPMPKFAPKLPACDIAKIEKWVSEKALNN